MEPEYAKDGWSLPHHALQFSGMAAPLCELAQGVGLQPLPLHCLLVLNVCTFIVDNNTEHCAILQAVKRCCQSTLSGY